MYIGFPVQCWQHFCWEPQHLQPALFNMADTGLEDKNSQAIGLQVTENMVWKPTLPILFKPAAAEPVT